MLKRIFFTFRFVFSFFSLRPRNPRSSGRIKKYINLFRFCSFFFFFLLLVFLCSSADTDFRPPPDVAPGVIARARYYLYAVYKTICYALCTAYYRDEYTCTYPSAVAVHDHRLCVRNRRVLAGGCVEQTRISAKRNKKKKTKKTSKDHSRARTDAVKHVLNI